MVLMEGQQILKDISEDQSKDMSFQYLRKIGVLNSSANASDNNNLSYHSKLQILLPYIFLEISSSF